MSLELVFPLWYIITMSLAAPLIWITAVPTITLIVKSNMKTTTKIGLGSAMFAMIVGTAISWLYQIGFPAAEGYYQVPITLAIWEHLMLLCTWPTAILSAVFFYRRWKEIKKQAKPQTK